MKIEYLKDRVADYKASIETVVDKKTYWQEHTKPLLLKTLSEIVASFNLGGIGFRNWIGFIIMKLLISPSIHFLQILLIVPIKFLPFSSFPVVPWFFLNPTTDKYLFLHCTRKLRLYR